MAFSGRWDQLAFDLEAQAAALDSQERADEVAERLRYEVGQQRFVDRLRAAVGETVSVMCAGSTPAWGTVRRVVADAVLLEEQNNRECLIAITHITGLNGAGRLAAPPSSPASVEGRVDLRILLRAIARDRSAVRVSLIDGSSVNGTLDRIGADFAELAVHAPGEARRRDAVRQSTLLRLAAIVSVRRDSE